VFVCECHCLNAVAQLELEQDAEYVRFHGPFGDKEGVGDFGIGKPTCDVPEYLELSGGEFGDAGEGGALGERRRGRATAPAACGGVSVRG